MPVSSTWLGLGLGLGLAHSLCLSRAPWLGLGLGLGLAHSLCQSPAPGREGYLAITPPSSGGPHSLCLCGAPAIIYVHLCPSMSIYEHLWSTYGTPKEHLRSAWRAPKEHL
eukprot:scaffold8728_cov42-Phaeocystis_antarctica.AAC.1